MIPIKTPQEIQWMREGALILNEVLEKMLEIAKPGVSTAKLDEIAESMIRSHQGAEPGFKGYNGFPATLCTSVNEEVVHGIPRKDCILQEGDIVGIDCGVLYKGLYTDACRTALVGQVSPEVHHFVKNNKKALKECLKAVKPGNHVGDISAIIQKVITQQGYSPVVECTGHGVGKNLHEEPEIMNVGQKGKGPLIKPGMVFAIEPISTMGDGQVITGSDGWTIVSADATLSAHFEHTVLVTENGHDVLV